jgi:putative NADPH-quinone reductase
MKIVIIQGHPDNSERHFGHALAEAYAEAARASGHEVSTIEVAALDFPVLRSAEDWKHRDPVEAIADSQKQIHEAAHIAIFYPLWLGTMPALLKAFFEQLFRPGYAMHMDSELDQWTRLLRGKTARLVVTMGMPGFAYRLFYRAHSLKSLERNILKFVGIKPVRATVIGLVESTGKHREKALKRMRYLGARAR